MQEPTPPVDPPSQTAGPGSGPGSASAQSPQDPAAAAAAAAAWGSSVDSVTSTLRDGKTHLLLAASGSVATIKLPQIVAALSSRHHHPTTTTTSSISTSSSKTTITTTQQGLSIRIVLTPSAARFLAGQSAEQPRVASLLLEHPAVEGVHLDEDEWGPEPGWTRGRPILHIELRRWAHLLVVAPLSANTLAKVAGGFAEGLLASVVRAWDCRGELDSDVVEEVAAAAAAGGGQEKNEKKDKRKKKKRIIVAPAMNTAMWRHPVTAKQIRVLEEEWGVAKRGGEEGGGDDDDDAGDDDDDDDGGGGDGWFEVLHPQKKTLACGDVGDGAMVEWTEIVRVIEQRLGLPSQ